MAGLDQYTKLLVHADGNNGSAAIVDSSNTASAHIGSFVGTAQLSVAQSKFSGCSLLLDGNSDYVTLPDSADWDFGTDPWTVDFWVRMTTKQNCGLVGQGEAPGANYNMWYCYYDSGNNLLKFAVYSNSGAPTLYFSAPLTVTVNTWYHIAFVRVNTDDADTAYRVFIDGVAQTLTKIGGAWNGSMSSNSGTLQIGFDAYNNANYLAGYLDELRISDTARWTSNFTPSTTPYTADANTKLLLHFDAADTPFTGNTPKIGTFVGTAQHSTAQAKFNQSILLDGNSDYISFADSTDFDFGTDPFTIDFWFRSSSFAASQTPLGGEASSVSWLVTIASSTLIRVYYSDLVAGKEFTVSLSVDTWYHCAIVRDGNDMHLFIDGVLQETEDVTGLSYDRAEALYVGFYPGSYFNGYLDEIRISKGIARWTTNFTPPTEPYSLGGPGDILKVSGVLLTGVKKFIGVETDDIKKIIGVA